MKKTYPEHLLRGKQAEDIACDYLLQQGLRFLCSNFTCQYGELDLIMQDGDTLVIVEVRFRKNQTYGGALASITKKKQAKIINASQYFIGKNNLGAAKVRFDVVTMTIDKQINWIQNAFCWEKLPANLVDNYTKTINVRRTDSTCTDFFIAAAFITIRRG